MRKRKRVSRPPYADNPEAQAARARLREAEKGVADATLALSEAIYSGTDVPAAEKVLYEAKETRWKAVGNLDHVYCVLNDVELAQRFAS